MKLKANIKAPNFKLPSTDKSIFELKKVKKKNVILYFYPKDDTPGCTIESKDFSKLNNLITKNNTIVLGVSKDSIKSHLKFIKKYKLKFNLLSDEKLKLIKKWLAVAVNEGENLEARGHMITSSSMGATAFQKGLGAIHSLSHPVNSLFNVHHGLSNGIFMPYVLTFNRSAIENKIGKLSGYLDLKEDSFNSFVDWVLELREQIKIPHTISDSAKITDQDIEKMSPMALDDPCTPSNPKKTTLDDMISMYEHSLQGKLF